MTKRPGKAYITKIASAQRLLSAGIRMFFYGEDELAVHTVASASYRLLSDLKSKRGRNEAADIHGNKIFYVIRDYRRGKLPGYIIKDPELMKWIKENAAKSPITANSDFKDFKFSISSDATKDYWRKRNKISNFLKHADRDLNSHINLDQVDNLDLLCLALSAYIDLSLPNIWPEGLVIFVYMIPAKGIKEGTHDEFLPFVSELENYTKADQLVFCSSWIKTAKEILANSTERLDEVTQKNICKKSFELTKDALNVL